MLWLFLLSFALLLACHLLLRFEREIEKKFPGKGASTLLGISFLAGLIFAFICGGFINNMMEHGSGYYYVVNGIKWSQLASQTFDKIAVTFIAGAACSLVAMGLSYGVRGLYNRAVKNR